MTFPTTRRLRQKDHKFRDNMSNSTSKKKAGIQLTTRALASLAQGLRIRINR